MENIGYLPTKGLTLKYKLSCQKQRQQLLDQSRPYLYLKTEKKKIFFNSALNRHSVRQDLTKENEEREEWTHVTNGTQQN